AFSPPPVGGAVPVASGGLIRPAVIRELSPPSRSRTLHALSPRSAPLHPPVQMALCLRDSVCAAGKRSRHSDSRDRRPRDQSDRARASEPRLPLDWHFHSRGGGAFRRVPVSDAAG